jgi:WD40 repeat protein
LRAIGTRPALRSLAYSKNGSRIASTDARSILVWDIETGDVVRQIQLQANAVGNLMYTPDGTQVVSGCGNWYSGNHTIKFWDAEAGDNIGKPLAGHTKDVNYIACSSDGSRLVSGSADKTIKIWDAKTAPFYNLSERFNTDLDVEMENDGWIFQKGQRLLWVPEDCRSGLRSAALLTIPVTGYNRMVRLDISQMRHGSSWAEILSH